MTLPASGFGVPIGARITASGELAQTALLMIAADTGRFWRAIVSGAPPVWSFVAAPSCSDIRGDFATCIDLRAAVGTAAQLRTWGFA